MSCKALLSAMPLFSLALMLAVPCAAMQTVPAARNSDGTPRFSDSDAAPRSFSSGPGQVTTTLGNGSITFGATSNYGWGTGYQGAYGPPVTSPYYTGPSSFGLSDPAFPNSILPGSQFYPLSPYSYGPTAPVSRVDPNKPR